MKSLCVRKMLLLAASLSLPFLVSGCAKTNLSGPTNPGPSIPPVSPGGQTSDSGTIVTQVRNVPYFHSLHTNAVADVFITQ